MKFRLIQLTALSFVAIAISAHATTDNKIEPNSNSNPTLKKQPITPAFTAPRHPHAKKQSPREGTLKTSRDIHTIDVTKQPNEHSKD